MSDGLVGTGHGTTIGGLAYGPESPEGMKLAIDAYFAPILLASDPNRVARTMARRHNIFKLKIGKGDPTANVAHVAAINQPTRPHDLLH